MNRQPVDQRFVWLVVGVVAGLCLSYFWPHEPALADATDRNDKLAMTTSQVELTNDVGAIFVLDFLNGRLTGGVLSNRNGKFSHAYFRNVAADFGVKAGQQASYSIVPGRCSLPSQGRETMAKAVIYVAELSSGRVIGYGFTYNVGPPGRKVAAELIPLDSFQFREAVN